MGLISFVKNAGASIFGGSEAKAAPADELKKELDKHGLNSSGVKIEVDGDKVKVSGSAKSDRTGGEDRDRARQHGRRGNGAKRHQARRGRARVEVLHRQVGDTLWAIAEREYGRGHGAKYDVIFQANRPMLTHPDKIYPGQVLRVPPLA